MDHKIKDQQNVSFTRVEIVVKDNFLTPRTHDATHGVETFLLRGDFQNINFDKKHLNTVGISFIFESFNIK